MQCHLTTEGECFGVLLLAGAVGVGVSLIALVMVLSFH
jgi:hypothetical protein